MRMEVVDRGWEISVEGGLIAVSPCRLIEGFIDRSNAHEKLKMCQSGTFLARFSEHTCGAISVTYIQGQ